MDSWRVQQVHSILYKVEERQFIQEALQDDPVTTYHWVENTLIYKFKLNQSIRLDYLLQGLKKGYLAMSYGQLLNLIVKVCKHLIRKRRYIGDCIEENIWINLKPLSLAFTYTFERIDFSIQYVGYKYQNQATSLDSIIYPLISSMIKLFPENYQYVENYNMQLKLYQIIVVRPEDILLAKLEEFRNNNYDFQNQLLTKERIREIENLRECQILKNKFIEHTQNEETLPETSYDINLINKHYICLKKLLNCLQQYNLQEEQGFMRFFCIYNQIDDERSAIETDNSIAIRRRFIEYNKDISDFLDSDLNLFQQQINQRCRIFQLNLNEEFRTQLQTLYNLNLKEHFLYQGWLNDESQIRQFIGNNPTQIDFRQITEQAIYDTKIKPLLIQQLNSRIRNYVNDVWQSLPLN